MMDQDTRRQDTRLQPFDSFGEPMTEYVGDPEIRAPEKPYVREPLFSRRAMIGWAVATIVVWFGFTMIVPRMVESAKSAIVESLEVPASNSAVSTERRLKNGTVIRKTNRRISVEIPGRAPIVIEKDLVPVPPAASVPTPAATTLPSPEVPREGDAAKR